MTIRSPRDFWAGLFFVAIAAAFIGLAQQYSLGTMHRMGPALFPTMVGGLLTLLGLVISLRSLVLDGPAVPRLHVRPIGIAVVAIGLFALALQFSGLVAAVIVLVAVAAVASTESRAWETVALAAALAVFSVAVFVWLLGLPIPLWPGD